MFENEPWSLRPIRKTSTGSHFYFEPLGPERTIRFIQHDGSLGTRYVVSYSFLLMTVPAGPDLQLAERLAKKSLGS